MNETPVNLSYRGQKFLHFSYISHEETFKTKILFIQ